MSNTTQNCNNILYVSNFQRNTSESDIHKLFSGFGTINSISIIPKNQYAFAFVEFDDIRDAVDAVKELNKSFFRGKNLKVEYKNPKSSDMNPSSKPSSERQADTGDQLKSKEEIQGQKKPIETPEPQKKKKKKGKRKNRQRRSRSRSRNKRSRKESRSRSPSYSDSECSEHEEKNYQAQTKKCLLQIQKLYGTIDKLQRRIRVLEEERSYHRQKKAYSHSNR